MDAGVDFVGQLGRPFLGEGPFHEDLHHRDPDLLGQGVKEQFVHHGFANIKRRHWLATLAVFLSKFQHLFESNFDEFVDDILNLALVPAHLSVPFAQEQVHGVLTFECHVQLRYFFLDGRPPRLFAGRRNRPLDLFPLLSLASVE
jgi:hypothetical protein